MMKDHGHLAGPLVSILALLPGDGVHEVVGRQQVGGFQPQARHYLKQNI